jgi:protein-tyrosine kinase
MSPRSRPHLVERAMEALAGGASLDRPAQAAAPPSSLVPPATPTPPSPAAAPYQPVKDLPGEAPAAAPVPLGPAPSVHSPLVQAPSGQAPVAPPVISLAALKQAGLVVGVTGTTRNRISEEISVVQHHLMRTVRSVAPAEGRCNRIILITSARPGEGKTFSSLNIAASIAASGTTPVLLIDADGKYGSLSELLGVHEKPGVRLLVADPQATAGPLCLPTAQPNLSVLSYGAAAPRPGQPDQPPAPMVAKVILDTALAMPDHVVVIDSAPCLSTSDPGSFALVAGQVLMVVQAERTQKNEVEAALDIVDACPTLQLMLNRTRLTGSDTFGAYGGYHIYGAHGSRPKG